MLAMQRVTALQGALTVHGTVHAARRLRDGVRLQEIGADGVQDDDALRLCKLRQMRGDRARRAGVLGHSHAAARPHYRTVQQCLKVLHARMHPEMSFLCISAILHAAAMLGFAGKWMCTGDLQFGVGPGRLVAIPSRLIQ